jgi:flagellar basal body-associated protein FliL
VQDAIAIVVVGVVVVAAIIGLAIALGSSGKLYDQIGRGGLSIGDERDGPMRASAPAPAVSAAERDTEIRQLLEARNERRAAKGEATVDVEAELRRLTAPSVDDELRDEIRQLVEARNARRVARGHGPLDVEAEVARRIREINDPGP